MIVVELAQGRRHQWERMNESAGGLPVARPSAREIRRHQQRQAQAQAQQRLAGGNIRLITPSTQSRGFR